MWGWGCLTNPLRNFICKWKRRLCLCYPKYEHLWSNKKWSWDLTCFYTRLLVSSWQESFFLFDRISETGTWAWGLISRLLIKTTVSCTNINNVCNWFLWNPRSSLDFSFPSYSIIYWCKIIKLFTVNNSEQKNILGFSAWRLVPDLFHHSLMK